MKYSFTCPADNQVLSTTANTDDEAMKKLLEIGNKHMKQFHKDMPPMSEEEARKMIRSVWKKEK
jgi:hypothetical protein